MKSNRPEGVTREILDEPVESGSDMDKWTVKLVCEALCDYYRGESDEEGCGGLAAVRTGLQRAILRPSHLELLVGRKPVPPRRLPDLINKLCCDCSYKADDCDFMSEDPAKDATPCGGYRLLFVLMRSGVLKPDKLSAILSPDSI